MEWLKSLISNKKWALIIGFGLALYPIHNKWLTDATSINGQATLFLPAIGAAIWIVGILFYIVNNYKSLDLGDKKVYIPLILIVLSIAVSGFINGQTVGDKISPLFMSSVFFATYVATRKIGSDIFLALIPITIIGVITVVVSGLVNLGTPTGGFITNYCASAGYIIFASIISHGKWQWLLILFGLVGLFFVGALEGAFILGVLGLTVLFRLDINKKFIISSLILLSLITLWAILGYLTPLYKGNDNLSALFNFFSGQSKLDWQTMKVLTSGRWEIIVGAMQDINLFGHGFSLSTVGGGIVHNIPLIIVHQVGILAGACWLFVSLYCLIKTRYKYAWIAVLAMSVFDHYIWTQFSPYWWALVGMSLTSKIDNDLIFRGG